MTGLFSHSDCRKHEMGAGHPEQPARLDSVEQAVAGSTLAAARLQVEAAPADRVALIRAHDERFVDSVLSAAPVSGYRRLDADTCIRVR